MRTLAGSQSAPPCPQSLEAPASSRSNDAPMGSATAGLITAAGMLMLNRALLHVGLRSRVDGWRRATGIMLRAEASTFVLSAFGLDAWSDARPSHLPEESQTRRHVAERLANFLRAESACHVMIVAGDDEDRLVRTQHPTYTLGFDDSPKGPARFIVPRDWQGEPQGSIPREPNCLPLLNLICRLHEDGRVDLWARVNHVGADGVPMQEMLSRLEQQWGGSADVRYPTPNDFESHAVARPLEGRADLAEIQSFIDFSPLLAWRKQANVGLPAPMTLSAAVLWALAHRPELEDLVMGTTVEVAPQANLDRGVGVVALRPADYLHKPRGLASYVADFNRDMEWTRQRISGSCRTLDAAAHLPPGQAAILLRHALNHKPRAFGSLALTMLKDARVFGAPIAETGHPAGFIAIGSVSLASDDGRTVGSITVKGPPAVITKYPRIIQDAISHVAGASRAAG